MFRKYINKNKLVKKRDCIIAICALLRLDTNDTNEGLYYYNMPELNGNYSFRDYVIERFLDIQSDKQLYFEQTDNQSIEETNKRIIDELNNELIDNHESELDIIERRNKTQDSLVSRPYTLVKTKVEWRTNVPLDSLENRYSYYNYCIRSSILLDDNGKK